MTPTLADRLREIGSDIWASTPAHGDRLHDIAAEVADLERKAVPMMPNTTTDADVETLIRCLTGIFAQRAMDAAREGRIEAGWAHMDDALLVRRTLEKGVVEHVGS